MSARDWDRENAVYEAMEMEREIQRDGKWLCAGCREWQEPDAKVYRDRDGDDICEDCYGQAEIGREIE